MKNKFTRKAISIVLAVLIGISSSIPAMTAFAGNGVEDYYTLEIFDAETDTMVPTNNEDGSEYNIYMYEGDTKQFTYKLINTVAPDSSYIKWYSENPVLVDTDQTGKVKAFDASKGAVIHYWIDNEVKTIPILGKALGPLLEKVFFNEYVNLDTMDTQAIVDLLIKALGSESWIADYIEAYQGQLVDSLRYYLDHINSNIVCQIYAADGTMLAEDKIHITVLKNEEWYAAFLPNGTHITNKSQISTTQAVGNEVQIYAITTPQRLKFGTVYSVKSSSIFSKGKSVATVNDSGLVKFKNPGTATIQVSPDSEQVIAQLMKFINYFYDLNASGSINSDKMAQILIDYIGLDINREALRAILDTVLAIIDAAQGATNPAQLVATAAEILANVVLQMVYNDSITFNVVESQPITSFNLSGNTTVKEGTQIQLEVVDVVPDMGDKSDITWKSSKPEVASVDEKTGVITGLDAGGSYGELSSQTCEIIATSAANGVERRATITVTGKTGSSYISDVQIIGDSRVELNASADYSYTVFPKRVAESDKLYVDWGIQTGTDEEGNPQYVWATADEPAVGEHGTLDAKGHYTSTSGGSTMIALRAKTGINLSADNFYEISTKIVTKEVSTGVPIDEIKITATGTTSNGKLNRNETKTINGKEYQFVTIHKGAMEGYYNNGIKLSAEIFPADATNQNIQWRTDNSYFKVTPSDDTHSVEIVQKANHEQADSFNVWAVGDDGRRVSNVITVCITKKYVEENKIEPAVIEVVNSKTATASHTVTYEKNAAVGDPCYNCNWFSSDESVFTVENTYNDKNDAVLTGQDVGEAILYSYTADGAKEAQAKVIVKPNKDYLRKIVTMCDSAVVERTAANKTLYKQYLGHLDLAYSVLYDHEMASQDTCDTYADNLLRAFYKLGGYITIGNVRVRGTKNTALKSKYVSVKVGSVANYKNYSYDFDYELLPKESMYDEVKWTSSSPSTISVDQNGVCRPVDNKACGAVITCTVTDYLGNAESDSVYVAFARTKATGVKLSQTEMTDRPVDTTQQLTATVLPTDTLGKSSASVQNVVWSSSDESIATVDGDGVVTFHAGGDCIIRCTTVDGGYTAECKVNVITNYDKLRNLIQQYTDLRLNEIDYYPDTWKVYTDAMAEAQAMIDRGGYSQYAVNDMRDKLENAYKSLKKYNYIQKVELYLDGEETKEFYQYDASLFKEGFSYKNAVLDLNVRLYPNNASYKDVVWESSTSNISVTSDGKCTPTINKPCYGMITCTVTDHYGNSYSDSVWVSYSYVPVTELVLSDPKINGRVGDTHQLTCTVKPTGLPGSDVGSASIKDYYWESDDESIATISNDPDSKGVVTFVNAGTTKVRAVSYDGGVSAECIVSTEGDRSKLKEYLDKYRDIDITQYNYDYAQTFKRAYANAENALTDLSLSQQGIDDAANALNAAATLMIENPYIKTQSVDITYKAYKDPTIGGVKEMAHGTIADSNALSVNISSGYATNNYNNYVVLTAGLQPSNAMYKSVEWQVVQSDKMKASTNGTQITLTPTEKSDGGWAEVKYVVTDHYGLTVSRTVFVSMADKTCTGISVNPSEMSMYATDSPYTAYATLSGNPDIKKVFWSSSDTSVATVSDSGVITPVNNGYVEITAKSLDGGYTASIRITITADYSVLAAKVVECEKLIAEAQGNYMYTDESLEVLSAAVLESKEILEKVDATQLELNSYLDTLNAAYDALVKYEPVKGVTIKADSDQQKVTEPNEGFIRFTDTFLVNKTVQLVADLQPANAITTSVTWESSNPNITVDQFGLVTNTKASSDAALITCTVENVYGESYTNSAYVSFVTYPVKAVTFSDEMIYGAPQEVKPLSYSLNQDSTLVPTTIVKKCIYKSSDENVATVDENGNVTFKTQGSAVITVTALDGGFSGSITAYTTWDTTALQQAIATAKTITYTDYAYAQGTAFKAAHDKANEVYANVFATQAEIDTACANLLEAITNLEGNEFVLPNPVIMAGSKQVADGAAFEINDSKQVTFTYQMNEGAMIKSATLSLVDTQGLTAGGSADSLVVTKTAEDAVSTTIKLTVIDDYDREYEYSYNINIVNQIVAATDFDITINGDVYTGSYASTGHKVLYTDFKPLQLGYVLTPSNATEPQSVVWSIENPSRTGIMEISSDGVLSLTTTGKAFKSNTADIKCTINNADGSVIVKTINVVISR